MFQMKKINNRNHENQRCILSQSSKIALKASPGPLISAGEPVKGFMKLVPFSSSRCGVVFFAISMLVYIMSYAIEMPSKEEKEYTHSEFPQTQRTHRIPFRFQPPFYLLLFSVST